MSRLAKIIIDEILTLSIMADDETHVCELVQVPKENALHAFNDNHWKEVVSPHSAQSGERSIRTSKTMDSQWATLNKEYNLAQFKHAKYLDQNNVPRRSISQTNQLQDI